MKKINVLSKISLTLIATSSLFGCSHGPVPRWNGDLWVGDSKRAAIVRKDTLPDGTSQETVKAATDPFFDKGLWMSYNDFRALYATYVLGCAKWRNGIPLMTSEEALMRFRIVIEDMEREVEQQEAEKRAKK